MTALVDDIICHLLLLLLFDRFYSSFLFLLARFLLDTEHSEEIRPRQVLSVCSADAHISPSMAQAKINTDRLFLSRLSETYKCRPGDNVFLECYVRHQRVKSIAWYAKGERVDSRGVRAWYRYDPSTGQTILCLRSVLNCDEGSYCCEATSTDNVVETLEIKLKIDNRTLRFSPPFKRVLIEFALVDKSWTRIPVLYMAGRVLPGGKKTAHPFRVTCYLLNKFDEEYSRSQTIDG